MILICAWCKQVLEEKEPLEDTTPTHGICKPCADAIKNKYGMLEALDSNDIANIESFIDKDKT